MAVLGLNHINLRLSQAELTKVVDFYVNVLGFAVGERPPFNSSGVWLYAGGQPIVHLVEAGPEERSASHGKGAIDHVALSCADFDGSLRRLQAAGIEYDERRVPERPMRQLFFEDPAGVMMELLFDD